MWLDVARYADSKGYGSDPLRTIWRYRDWVIDAFNRNLPYDRFTVEQLAGDLLPGATADQILATAFHRNTMANDEGGTDDEEFRVAAVKDRIDTTMQVWMGLTIGCAKCHSHKFDPITQREYYEAYAFFDQTEDADRGDEEPKMLAPTRQQQQQLADRRAQRTTLEQQLALPPSGLDADLNAWEQSVRQQESRWVVLEPTKASADEGSSLEILPDRSVRAQGTAPDRDTYHLEFASDLSGITAFRLDALPDESLPAHGPGRAGGNFVINEIRIDAAPQSAASIQGRFLRIELPGANRILSLAEVQLFRGAENLAPQGKAQQSSTSYDAGAALAIDAQTSGEFQQHSVTHTNEEDNPWWEVDLGKTVPVDRAAIWNRTDGALESRLNGMRILVLDENHKPVWQRTIAEPPRPSLQFELTGPTQVDLAVATSDFAQDGWPADRIIDGELGAKSGWAVAPAFGKSHYAVLATKKPLVFDGPARFTLTMVQSYGGQHTLGRFRISAIAAQPAAWALADGHP